MVAKLKLNGIRVYGVIRGIQDMGIDHCCVCRESAEDWFWVFGDRPGFKPRQKMAVCGKHKIEFEDGTESTVENECGKEF